MAKILSIIRKDTLVRFASPIEWIFFLVLPLMFTLVLGVATGVYDDSRSPLKVMDFSPAGSAEELLDALEGSDVVRIERVAAEDSFETIRLGREEALLAIAPDFTATGGELKLLLAPNALYGSLITQELQTILSRFNAGSEVLAFSMAQAQAAGLSGAELEAFRADAEAQIDARLQEPGSRMVLSSSAAQDSVRYDPKANSAAGQMITWVSINLLGVSQMLAEERKLGTLSRLLSTPTTRGTYLAGTLIGQVLTAMLQMGILLGISGLLMGMNWGRDPLALALLLLSFALAVAALGTLMGTLVRSTAQANGLSILAGMLMGLLGGCWFPAELFPAAVRQASMVLPSTWAMRGMLDLTLSGGGLAELRVEILVLLGFALLFFTAAVWRFRRVD